MGMERISIPLVEYIKNTMYSIAIVSGWKKSKVRFCAANFTVFRRQ
jgi:hypothetical protein